MAVAEARYAVGYYTHSDICENARNTTSSFLPKAQTRSPSSVTQNDTLPLAEVNKIGGLRRALPTIVSFPNSYKFSFQPNGDPGPGMLYNHDTRQW